MQPVCITELKDSRQKWLQEFWRSMPGIPVLIHYTYANFSFTVTTEWAPKSENTQHFVYLKPHIA